MTKPSFAWTSRSPIALTTFIVIGLSLTVVADGKIRQFLQGIQVSALHAFLEWFTWTGHAGLLLLLACGFLAWGVWQRQAAFKTAGSMGVVALLINHIVVKALKHLIGRPRPEIMDSRGFHLGPSLEMGYDSFPSGHAISAFTIAVVLSYVFPQWRGWWYGAAVLVAFTRVYLDVHFVSDVVAGAILGILITKAIIRFHQRYQPL